MSQPYKLCVLPLPHVEPGLQHLQVVVFSWSGCPFCKKAKAVLDSTGAKYTALELDQMADGELLIVVLIAVQCCRQGVAGGAQVNTTGVQNLCDLSLTCFHANRLSRQGAAGGARQEDGSLERAQHLDRYACSLPQSVYG